MNKQLIVSGPFHELEELKLFLIAELESDNPVYAETLRRTTIYSMQPKLGDETPLGQYEIFEFIIPIVQTLAGRALYDLLIKEKIEEYKTKNKSELELREGEEKRSTRRRKKK